MYPVSTNNTPSTPAHNSNWNKRSTNEVSQHKPSDAQRIKKGLVHPGTSDIVAGRIQHIEGLQRKNSFDSAILEELDQIFTSDNVDEALRDFLDKYSIDSDSKDSYWQLIKQLCGKLNDKAVSISDVNLAMRLFEIDPIFVRAWSRNVLRANGDFLYKWDLNTVSKIDQGITLRQLLGEKARKHTSWLRDSESAQKWFKKDVIFVRAWSRKVLRANLDFLLDQNLDKESKIEPETKLGELLEKRADEIFWLINSRIAQAWFAKDVIFVRAWSRDVLYENRSFLLEENWDKVSKIEPGTKLGELLGKQCDWLEDPESAKKWFAKDPIFVRAWLSDVLSANADFLLGQNWKRASKIEPETTLGKLLGERTLRTEKYYTPWLKDSKSAQEWLKKDVIFVRACSDAVLRANKDFLLGQNWKRASEIEPETTLGQLLGERREWLEDSENAQEWLKKDVIFVRAWSDAVLRANGDFLLEANWDKPSEIEPETTLRQLLGEKREWLEDPESAEKWFKRDPLFVRAWSDGVLRANGDFLLEANWDKPSEIEPKTTLGQFLGQLLGEKREWLKDPEIAKKFFARDRLFVRAWSIDALLANVDFLRKQNLNKKSEIESETTLGQLLRKKAQKYGISWLTDSEIAKKFFEIDPLFVKAWSDAVLRANEDFLSKQDLNKKSEIEPETTLGQLLGERLRVRTTSWLKNSECAKKWFERDPLFVRAWSDGVLLDNVDFLFKQDLNKESKIALEITLGELLVERVHRRLWLTDSEIAKKFFEIDVICLRAWSDAVLRANKDFLFGQDWDKESEIEPGTTLGQLLREMLKIYNISWSGKDCEYS